MIYEAFFYFTHPLECIVHLRGNITAKKIVRNKKIHEPKVSIIIITYNALHYVKLCIESLRKTTYRNKEIIIIDNNSNSETRDYLRQAEKTKLIDRLYLSPENTFFTGGNNIGASISSKNSRYLLFLNSDVEIKNPYWLTILMANKPKEGVISFGKVNIPVIRPDGWCFMVDKKIYNELGGLNEYYKMNWSITEFTARVLQKKYTVKSIVNPNDYVFHFGQKSRPKKNTHIHNELTFSQVFTLFKGKKVNLLRI